MRSDPSRKARACGRVLSLALVAVAGTGPIGCRAGGTGEPDASIPCPDPLTRTECDVLAGLGVPLDAEKVFIFQQSSHLDISYKKSFDRYFDEDVAEIFRTALDYLDGDPRYYYSICEIAFLKRYWDAFPEERPRIQRHAASGHLRIVGGGLTSPDTLLSSGESLMRNYLRGFRWLDENLQVRPRAAWLPDSFGHSSATPMILESFGLGAVAFERIDGVSEGGYIWGVDPGPGVSTRSFLEESGSMAFTWRSPDGAEQLAHFLAFSYGEGSNLGYSIPLVSGVKAGEYDPTPENVDLAFDIFTSSREEKFSGLSRYEFIPVGADMERPHPDLLRLLDVWNQRNYHKTGIYAVAATFEHYADLLAAHSGRDPLPARSGDLAPYWLGFYATHSYIKELHYRTDAWLRGAETAGLWAEISGGEYPGIDLDGLWDMFLLSTHHDWITGTVNDETYAAELLPVGEQVESEARQLLDRVARSVADRIDTSSDPNGSLVIFNGAAFERGGVVEFELDIPAQGIRSVRVLDETQAQLPAQLLQAERFGDGSLKKAQVACLSPPVPSLGYRTFGLELSAGEYPEYQTDLSLAAMAGDKIVADPGLADRILLRNDRIEVDLSAAAAFWPRSLKASGGQEILAGATGLQLYRDNAGIWRLGSELAACDFEPLDEIGAPSAVALLHQGPVVDQVEVVSPGPGGHDLVCRFGLRAESGRLEIELSSQLPEERTLVASLPTTIEASQLLMGIGNGVVSRPARRIYDPTYWPGRYAVVGSGERGLIMLSRGSQAFDFDPESQVLRHVVHRGLDSDESCFSRGYATTGSDPARYTAHFALAPGGDQLGAARQDADYQSPLIAATTAAHAGGLARQGSLGQLAPDGVIMTALKRSADGQAVIARLLRIDPSASMASLRWIDLPATAGWIADGTERPEQALELKDGQWQVPLQRDLTTLRFE